MMQLDERMAMHRASQMAAKMIRRAARCCGEYESISVELKGPSDYVTEVDRRVEQAMIATLTREYSIRNAEVPLIISEESAECARLPGGFTGWLIDPLDSTSSFVFNVGDQYPAVMLSLLAEGEPQYSQIEFPLLRTAFYAQGNRAFVRRQGKEWTPLVQVNGSARLANSWVDLNRRADRWLESYEMRSLEEQLRRPGQVGLLTCQVPHSGAACAVAEGRLGAVVHDNSADDVKQAPWDIAPALHLVRAAGGVAVCLDGSEMTVATQKPFLLARSPQIAQELLGLCW